MCLPQLLGQSTDARRDATQAALAVCSVPTDSPCSQLRDELALRRPAPQAFAKKRLFHSYKGSIRIGLYAPNVLSYRSKTKPFGALG